MDKSANGAPMKGKVKNPIKFKIQLNEEQKEAKSLILENPVTVIRGMAGSGKTLLACQIALDLLFNREAEKIIITRPTVAKEDIGFLPGDLKEKMDPWLAPIYSNLYMLYEKEKIDKKISSHNSAVSRVGARVYDIMANQIMKGSKTSVHNAIARITR
jgi:phosphate starvation-inducible protein PhoH